MRKALCISALCISGLWVALAAACTQQAGALSEDVGGPCEDDVDCGSESICEDGAAFPDGMCSIECEAQDDCILSTICSVRGVCLVNCRQDSDCRDGYQCVLEDRPEGTTAMACVNAG